MATKPARGEGKVRYRRAAIPGLAALATTGVLVVATAQGALGVQFAISGMPFVVTASHLHGDGFQQYGGLDSTLLNDQKKCDNPWLKSQNCQALVMTSVIGHAQITNLCQSVNLAGINLVIRAGSGSKPVDATDLVIDSPDLSGDASFTNIQIGRDASDVNEVPGLASPHKYTFAQQSDTVDIDNIRQDAYATTASTFSLPGLSMSFQSKGC